MNHCPACQTSNRDIARFCRSCGTWLLPRCPFCNAEITVPSVFCDQCGRVLNSEAVNQGIRGNTPQEITQPTTLQPDQSTSYLASNLQSLIPAKMSAKLNAARQERAMEGQRRVVTMLFCDVKGSTEAASHLDPEEWAGIINGAFERMIAPVYHYEGTVARLMGDGLLAFFGAPIAHEDDPQRAVLAGLEIIEKMSQFKDEVFNQWEVEIDARVGVNTGLVVVGAVGSDLQVEYTALGDAINIAARMEQTAMPGTVQISEETHKLIAPLFEFEDLGLVDVKGKAEPVHTYQPLQPKSTPGSLRGIEGLQSPVIGREKEINTLRSSLENLIKHGVGGVIFLTGEAGIGKSRLIEEVLNSQSAPGVMVYKIAPLSFEASQPYALFRIFLRQLTGIEEMDSIQEARPKITALSERLPVELRGGAMEAFTSVLGLLDEDNQVAEGESFQRQLFAATREIVRAQFIDTPGVIVIDDFHWVDSASLEIFNHLFPLVETTPLMFLCATRPERDALAWRIKSALGEEFPHRFVEILIEPLSRENSNALVDHLLAVAELPPAVRNLILEKSEGNPFFLEEIIRSLIEDGYLEQVQEEKGEQGRWRMVGEIENLDIPDNLQTLLAARLDRLTEDTRQVVQKAAVIGRNFYYRVLQHITNTLDLLDGSLSTLQRMNMVVEAARLPELEYAFRHTLVQETAYRSILRTQRREFHRQVGEAMERLYADRLDEIAPVLAMHFERADDSERAFQYFLHSGDVSYRLHAIKEAISHYKSAKEIFQRNNLISKHMTPETLRHLCLRLGRALEMDGRYDEALEHYSELEIYAEEHEDLQLELAALTAHSTIHSTPTGKFDAKIAETLSQKALALAEQLGNHETEAKIYWNLMNTRGFSGDLEKGYEFGLKSLEIARHHNLKEQLAYTLNDFQRANLVTGNINGSKEMLEEAQQLWLELGNKAMYIDSRISYSLIFLIKGEYEKAENICLESLKDSQEIGNLWGQSYSYYTLGYIYTHQDRYIQAIEVMQNALRLVEPSGFAVPLVDSNVYIGLIYAYLGDFERGRSFVSKALEHAKQRMPALQVGPLAIMAILEYWQGNPDGMDEWLGKTDPTPEMNSFSSFERFGAECYRLFAKRKYEDLINLLEEIYPGIEPFGSLILLGDILCIWGETLLVLNRIQEARERLEIALAKAKNSPRQKIDIFSALSKLETAAGKEDIAKGYITEAQKNIEIILQNIDDQQLRDSFLNRPQIQSIWLGGV